MGKLFGEAKAEVALSAMIANWYADNAKDLLRPQRVYTIMGDAHYEYHSTGVIMAVEPWNFPYYQVMRVFAPNFMLGNPVMFKQASSVPTTASLLEKYTLKLARRKDLWLTCSLPMTRLKKSLPIHESAGLP